MKDGFYTALGTPYLPDGTLVEADYRKGIEQQIRPVPPAFWQWVIQMTNNLQLARK